MTSLAPARRTAHPTPTAHLTAVPEFVDASAPAPLRALGPAVAREPRQEPPVPEPHPGLIQSIALQAYEVTEGVRPVTSLGGAVTVHVAQHLSELRQLRDERRRINRDTRVFHAHPGSVRIDRPAPTVTEAAVVLITPGRAFAVALRLEWLHRRWRATSLSVL